MTASASSRSENTLKRPPDFFLVGAPKCATSSLHKLLIQHTGIFMCSPKEPHFFSTDLPGLAEVDDAAGYDGLFADAPAGASLGEASAFYLMSTNAAAGIHAANPNAKIIISIRNPAQAARSLFHQLRDGFREDQTTFEAAWVLQLTRASGMNLPSYSPEPQQLQYRDVYSYADQVARYLEVFGPDQVLILRFEEISQSPQDVIARILKFLDLPPFPAPVELPKTNTRRQARFPWLSQLISAPPPLLKPLMNPVKKALNAMGIKPSLIMMKYLSKSGGTAAKPAASNAAFQAQVAGAFDADVEHLERLTGFDLSVWRTQETS
jgi:hypothetical protein